MAKKKKTTKRSKKKPEVVSEKSSFWPLAGAVGLILIALLLILGGFGTGGPAPIALFHGAYWLFGWAAYLTPIALIYWGGYKFTTEDHGIPAGKLSSMLALMLFSSGFSYTAFASKDA